MGRKWTNIKFKFDDRVENISEASSNPRSKQKVVYDYIRTNWEEENLKEYDNIDVSFGKYSESKLREVLTEFFQEFPFLKSAGAVYVTDSANVGYGWYFENNNGNAELVEEYTGYEGAMGEDVTGEMYDDHYIRLDPVFCW